MNERRKVQDDFPHGLNSEEIMKGLVNESRFNMAVHRSAVILGKDHVKVLSKFKQEKTGGNENE